MGSKVDVWAAGVTLYLMLTGEYPFKGENMYRLFEAIAAGVFVPSPALDASAEDLLRRLLAKEPSDRPTAAEIRRFPWMVEPRQATAPDVPVWATLARARAAPHGTPATRRIDPAHARWVRARAHSCRWW